MKKMSPVLALCAILLAGSGFAPAQDADVGLVNQVAGEVTYSSGTGSGKVRPFTKLRDGDSIRVPAGAQVRIVFFDGARQELWLGPTTFRVGKTAAEPISGKAAEITNLPAGVPQRMARVPELIKSAKFGGMRVRGLPKHQQTTSLDQKATLKQARADYERMRQEMPGDDIFPELYLYAVLYEYREYVEMKAVVAEMLRKQPNNEDVKALDSWLASRTSR